MSDPESCLEAARSDASQPAVREPAEAKQALQLTDDGRKDESQWPTGGDRDGQAQRRMRDRERQQRSFGIDGVSAFMGMRWEDPQTVRLTIRPELINAGGLLSGVVTYALVDYCMGSTLWAQTSETERIATINISINYIQTATEGEIVCRTMLDRRNRSNAVMHSEVHDERDRLLVTAIGSYTIFVPKALRAQDDAKRAQDDAKRAQDDAKRAQDDAKRAR